MVYNVVEHEAIRSIKNKLSANDGGVKILQSTSNFNAIDKKPVFFSYHYQIKLLA